MKKKLFLLGKHRRARGSCLLKITDVRTYKLRCSIDEPFGCSKGWFDSRTATLVQVSTEEGISGFGECYGPQEPCVATIHHLLKPVLIGEDPFDVEKLWEAMYDKYRDFGQKGTLIASMSGVDIALWDIMGKKVGLPIHKLLGGCFRNKIKAYATGLYFKRVENLPESLADEARDYVDRGFAAIKMKVGLSPRRDLENVRRVREAIGDDIELMIDANHAYNAFTAIRPGRKLEKYEIGWFEEPVPPEDILGYLEVKRALDMAIAGGESEFTRYGFRELISRKAVDIVQPDICSAGGLTECKKIAAMANAWGIMCISHVWGTHVAMSAALHFIASLPDVPPSINPIPPMLEFDMTPNPIRDELLNQPIRQKNGFVDVPSKPGLGVEINEETINRYLVE